jgi:hypothetical protein
MGLKRTLVNMAVKGFGLQHLAGSRAQRECRAMLDELDLQQACTTFTGQRIVPTANAEGENDELRARYNFHQFLAKHVGTTRPIDYLEFGVYKGYIISLWAALNSNPASRFVGFDSFEGLPAEWKGGEWGSKGSFDTGGEVPEVGDDRVSFHKGWFGETLPPFMRTFTPTRRLVV